MRDFFLAAFLVVLVASTVLAVRQRSTQHGVDVSDAERRVFRRFVAGIVALWLAAIVAIVVRVFVLD